ncbi:MAG: metallophosphoesterase family protein [Treponema sp.]|nr:metallophosphoesterase family protein [Treponema sp.]
MASGNSLLLVISDSHGNMAALTAALVWARDLTLTAAVFLGDGADDLAAASAQAGFAIPWYKVRGNGDFNFSISDSLVLEISGPGEVVCGPGNRLTTAVVNPSSRKIFLAHGNRFGVGARGGNIAAAAGAVGAEAAFFGHTHIPFQSMENGIFLLNPGSIGRSRSDAGPTFAVLECPKKGPLSARFFCLKHKGRKIEVQELHTA